MIKRISTINNPNPVEITSSLIKCRSVTPEDGGAIELIEKLLSISGFNCTRINKNGISNLFARWGEANSGLTFCFNGHTDVVPPGAIESWTHKPFSAVEEKGYLYGRGAVDMKSAVAAFVCASIQYIEEYKPHGSIVIAITGDEEGEAKDGTSAILSWMNENNEHIDHCLVGEPTSKEYLGDTIKIGRRGSMTIKFTAFGLQGHVAYPEKAINPLPALAKLLLNLEKKSLDSGNEFFDPSSLVITSIDTENLANNVIPEKGMATINIRFNNLHSDLSLKKWIRNQIRKVVKKTGVNIGLEVKVSAQPFLSKPGDFSKIVFDVIKAETNNDPSFSTSGGTSDARFIQEYCPVVEFGLVGKTMHQTDENVEIKQIEKLKIIYKKILKSYFVNFPNKNS